MKHHGLGQARLKEEPLWALWPETAWILRKEGEQAYPCGDVLPRGGPSRHPPPTCFSRNKQSSWSSHELIIICLQPLFLEDRFGTKSLSCISFPAGKCLRTIGFSFPDHSAQIPRGFFLFLESPILQC